LSERFSDEARRKEYLEDLLKEVIPATAEVELKNQPSWDESNESLFAEYDIKIPGWITPAGRRAVLPLGIFAGAQKHVFEDTQRTRAIYFSFLFQTDDETKIALPAGWKVESGSERRPRGCQGSRISDSRGRKEKCAGGQTDVTERHSVVGRSPITRHCEISISRSDRAISNKRYSNRRRAVRRSETGSRWFDLAARIFLAAGIAAACSGSGRGSSEAPGWMHALTGVSLPEHDEKTDAVLLLSEEVLTVQGSGKIRRLTREAYKILRPSGRSYGTVRAYSSAQTKILNMHGWCIPAQGKDYEVKDKEAVETSLGVVNGELASDVRMKVMKIPEPEPGNIVGYEIEEEENLYVLQDRWMFQEAVPVREARYTLQLPPGWEFKAAWMNAAESKSTAIGNNQWQWTVSDVKEIRREEEMPPWGGVAGQMIVSLIPPDGSRKGFVSWADVGKWSSMLAQGRRDPSPEIKQKVAELSAGRATVLAKMQALANYVQRDIRYVAIEVGIGRWQPHPARDIYNNHYGDCKDKATLLSTMFQEMGVDSYYIVVNTARGAVSPETPPQRYFNHMILGIRLPDDVKDPSLKALYLDPVLGRVLIFDPTDEMTRSEVCAGHCKEATRCW